MEPQKRRLRMAMTPDEVDAFLTQAHLCRLATNSADGTPHISPLWFGWDGSALWFYSVVRTQRWTDVQRDPRAAVVVDDGHEFGELRGVELRGTLEVVGAAPVSDDQPETAVAERLFADKYMGGTMLHDGRHAWLRLTPAKLVSWDHRKLAS
jgi:PPOX class probable F420-dependent enzyme